MPYYFAFVINDNAPFWERYIRRGCFEMYHQFFMGLFGYDCISFFRRNYSIMSSKSCFVSLKNSSKKILRYISKQPLRQKKRALLPKHA